MALAAMSHWPDASARPLWSALKSESLIWTFTSSCCAIAFTMSTSKPLNPVEVDLSKSSNGGYGTSEHTVSVPDEIRFRSAEPDESVPDEPSDEPQAVREIASAAN